MLNSPRRSIRYCALFCLLAGATSCSYLAPPARQDLVVRESLRPTPWTYEILRVQKDVEEFRDMERWVMESGPDDVALSLGSLLLTGWNSVWPNSVVDGQVPGGDTYVSWHLDPSLAASHLLAQRLQDRFSINFLLESVETEFVVAAAGTVTQNTPAVLKADLHVHSAHSHDSATPLRGIFFVAQKRGLDVLAITDHDVLTYPEAKRVYNRMLARGEIQRPFVLIPGVEISSADGHIMAYFVHAPIPPGMDARATIAAIHAQGGIAVIAHPNLPGSGVHGSFAQRLPVDGVEAINGAELFPLAWRADIDHWHDISLAAYGSSDAHFAQWIGAAYTQIEVTEPTGQGVLDAMRQGRTSAHIGNRALSGYATALAAPGLRHLLIAANWPRRGWHRARAWLAEQLRVDDVYLRTSWRDIMLDAYRLNRLLDIPDRFNTPTDAIHLPPLPVETGVRFWGTKLFIRLPVRGFRGRPDTRYATLVDDDVVHERTSIVFDRPGDNVFFVWPSEIFIGAEWEWIF